MNENARFGAPENDGVAALIGHDFARPMTRRQHATMLHDGPPVIVPFAQPHQRGARELILAGLAERWGSVDVSMNPDLDDIGSTFAAGAFVVAVRDGAVVGTGGLLRRDPGTAEIVRMSVAHAERRHGLGRRVVGELVGIAQQWDVERVICETTSDWASAVAFYLACGFAITHEVEGDFGRDTYFERRLD